MPVPPAAPPPMKLPTQAQRLRVLTIANFTLSALGAALSLYNGNLPSAAWATSAMIGWGVAYLSRRGARLHNVTFRIGQGGLILDGGSDITISDCRFEALHPEPPEDPPR